MFSDHKKQSNEQKDFLKNKSRNLIYINIYYTSMSFVA